MFKLNAYTKGDVMNNISFKAKLNGFDDWKKQIAFETKTIKDSDDYALNYLRKDKNTGWDIFQLTYKNEEVVKYPKIKNSKTNKEDYSVDELLNIYRILRIKAALKLIELWKKEKQELSFENFVENLNKNEGIEPDVHIIGEDSEE